MQASPTRASNSWSRWSSGRKQCTTTMIDGKKHSCTFYDLRFSRRWLWEFYLWLLLDSFWFHAWLTLRSWRWRQHVPLKRQLTFKRLHGAISQQIEFVIHIFISPIHFLHSVQTFHYSLVFSFISFYLFIFSSVLQSVIITRFIVLECAGDMWQPEWSRWV
jgi:hypothetical protein